MTFTTRCYFWGGFTIIMALSWTSGGKNLEESHVLLPHASLNEE